jgi:DNA repair photolyase
MSPVHSFSAPRFRIRRRPAVPTTVRLFPECPEVISPIAVVGSPAPVADQHGNDSNRGTADCPPAFSLIETVTRPASSPIEERLTIFPGTQSPDEGPVRTVAAPLVGIARLAASSPRAETRRKSEERPEYFVLPVKSILNRCDSKRVPFEWTINPYRGCEFGCKYCYARYTHEYMEIDGGEFEKKIFVKQNAAALLPGEISRKYSYESKASGYTQAEHLAIGTATDPYQPAEREYGVTRACLEELAKREGLSISVITKSDQIVRDIDVLQAISKKSALSLNITVTTLKPRLARLLEPRAPRPDLRLKAVKELRAAGLHVGVSASPLLPGITDQEGELEAVAAAAKEAGAEWFFSGVLFLMPASAREFLPFVKEKFPRLAKQYDDWYRKNGYAPEEYRRKASERVLRIRKKLGFASRPWEGWRPSVGRAQLSLGWDAGEVSAELGRGKSCAAG